MTTRNALRFVIPAVAALALAAFAGGCAKNEPSGPQPVVRKTVTREPVKAAEAAAAQPVAAKDNAAAVPLYNPSGKRDPFVPFLRAEAAKPASRVDLSSLPPLQRFELAELRYVGILWGGKGVRALVEDGEGKGYSVVVGTKIGRNGGVVTRITDGEIVVREEFTDYMGAKVVRESALKQQTSGGK